MHPQNLRREAREQRREAEKQEARRRDTKKRQEKEAERARKRAASHKARKAEQRAEQRAAGWSKPCKPSETKNTPSHKLTRTIRSKRTSDATEDSWNEFEARWTLLMQSCSEGRQVLGSTIPWPRTDLIQNKMRAQTHGESVALYRALALRFHPDKFQQRVGKYMDETEALLAGQKACEMFQMISHLNDELSMQGP